MSGYALTQLQETGRVNVQAMTVAEIVQMLDTLGIPYDRARVFNITGVTLRVNEKADALVSSRPREAGR